MRQQSSRKKVRRKVRVESTQGVPSMTLERTAPTITAADIRRIVAKLKGEGQDA